MAQLLVLSLSKGASIKTTCELNTQVLIISFGTLPAAQAWLEETCAPFRLLLDPERTVYGAYGVERSLLRSWNLKTIWRYIQLPVLSLSKGCVLAAIFRGVASRATRLN